MKTPHSEIEQVLYRDLVRLISGEAPSGWTIAVLKVSLGEPGCEVQLDHIDSTGHIIWFDPEVALREQLCQACRTFQLAGQSEGAAHWSRASLTLSASGVISADFWRG